ncbi:hypothetical protein [Geodermatophilus sp. CPCC 206100]|uniref:hypothetical protein n=1 Tax=Geodermatophilus sp. CPCC 206100 TaxID=3020054 RepID=UPI003B000585
MVAPPLERLVTEYALFRLDSPAVADAIAGRSSAGDEASLLAMQLAEERETLDYRAQEFGVKRTDRRQWEKARTPVTARIAESEKRLANLTRTDTLTGLGTGEVLREQWVGLNLSRQAAILRTLIAPVTIAAGVRGARALDPDRVQVTWLL